MIRFLELGSDISSTTLDVATTTPPPPTPPPPPVRIMNSPMTLLQQYQIWLRVFWHGKDSQITMRLFSKSGVMVVPSDYLLPHFVVLCLEYFLFSPQKVSSFTSFVHQRNNSYLNNHFCNVIFHK